MSERQYLTSPPETTGMPPGVPYIVGNEAAERFSFYGMKAILTVFMTEHLLDMQGRPAYMGDAAAKEWLHYFGSAVYFFPVLGAIVADALFGKYHTILVLSIVYCIGHGVLALMDVPLMVGLSPQTLLGIGLALIAIGGGGIKPCVSAHVGDQFGRANQHLLSKVFGWFYFAINFGAMFSTIITPILLQRAGPGWAFGVPGILMTLATIIFWMGRNTFVHVPPAGQGFFKETFSWVGMKSLLNLVPLYLFVAMFWALFDQTASAWVLQANDMDRSVMTLDAPADPANLPLWHQLLSFVLTPLPVAPGDNVQQWELLSSQLQAVNPAFVMLLIPIFTYIVYPMMRRVFADTPLRKVGIGLFVTVLAFLVSTFIQVRIDNGGTPHMYWQVFAYLILTSAEIMVSITVLEFSYTQAPKRMKSFVMGLYLMSVTAGNLFVAQVNAYIRCQEAAGKPTGLEGAKYYWFFTACMLVTAGIYVVWSQFYRGQMFIQGDTDEPPPADLLPAVASVEP
ncbi:MAG: POT family MFS transporter [Planctomycetaceae bacterium]